MKRIPYIKSVMTPFPHSIEKGASLADAERLMREHEIRHLPVVEGGKLVSVINERDVECAREGDDALVADACRADAYVVDLTEPLDEVLEQMAERHVDAAVVLKEGKLAGIFTLTDVCRIFGRFLHGFFPPGDEGDAA